MNIDNYLLTQVKTSNDIKSYLLGGRQVVGCVLGVLEDRQVVGRVLGVLEGRQVVGCVLGVLGGPHVCAHCLYPFPIRGKRRNGKNITRNKDTIIHYTAKID